MKIIFGDDAVTSLRLKQLADRLGRGSSLGDGEAWSPAVDIFETESEVVLIAEVAGVPRQAIKVIVEGEVIRLFGQRSPLPTGPGTRYHRMEIASGAFARSFRISVPFDPEQVQAKIDDGFLTVTLPKRAAAVETHIEVTPA